MTKAWFILHIIPWSSTLCNIKHIYSKHPNPGSEGFAKIFKAWTKSTVKSFEVSTCWAELQTCLVSSRLRRGLANVQWNGSDAPSQMSLMLLLSMTRAGGVGFGSFDPRYIGAVELGLHSRCFLMLFAGPMWFQSVTLSTSRLRSHLQVNAPWWQNLRHLRLEP